MIDKKQRKNNGEVLDRMLSIRVSAKDLEYYEHESMRLQVTTSELLRNYLKKIIERPNFTSLAER
jgi:hypothetical protein